MSGNPTKIRGELQRLVNDHYTHRELDAKRNSETQRRRGISSDLIAFIAGVLVGATITDARATRRS